MHEKEFRRWMVSEIESYVLASPNNRLSGIDDAPIFGRPLVGFVSGADPIFDQLKTIIGEFHLTPYEAVSRIAEARATNPPRAEDLGVVSYVLPISQLTRKENAGMTDVPSRRWAHTRCFGERFNLELQAHVVKTLEDNGYLAVAPQLKDDMFKILVDDRIGFASTWSQRHVAFAAGLGTFGLCDGLITRKGKAHRLGSVVVSFPLRSPDRSSDIHADCLFFRGRRCMRCAERCPAGAITERGHDKGKCRSHSESKKPIVKELYGVAPYGCGLCQTDVPCESRSPVRRSGGDSDRISEAGAGE